MEQAALQSWIAYDSSCPFPLENIPFGCYQSASGEVHCCTRIGDKIVDLAELHDAKKFPEIAVNVFKNETLNKFAAMGKDARIGVRKVLQTLFAANGGKEALGDELIAKAVVDASSQTLTMPVFIRDYTDFYSSKNHAYNIGVMFRGKDNALQPNWTHLPVGYHGRASSIVLDGTPIRRPKGQINPDATTPQFAACKGMDFELEMGTIIGVGNELGKPIKIDDAKDHIFGHCLLNDWSARDIQKWEYVPLGPFLAKNFASTISPWIITPEALSPFKQALPVQDPQLLPYLQDKDLSAYNIELEVHIKTEKASDWHTLSKSNMTNLYYSASQTITHHSVTGCNMNPGDMLGSGTISSTEKSGYGSMVELCWGGKEPVDLPSGEQRKFLADGDEINMTGVCKGNGFTIGFGDCRGKILPALDDSNYF